MTGGQANDLVAKINDLLPMAFTQKVKDLINTIPDMSDLRAFADALEHQSSVGIDDRLLLLEKILHEMAALDEIDPGISLAIQQVVIDNLFTALPHPPSGFLTTPPSPSSIQAVQADRTYVYRPADGSNYNPLIPTLGKVGHPYARSVPSSHCLSNSALPDPDLVFDALLKRDKFTPHRGGMSSLFFAFADLIIHDIFHSSPDGISNLTSSYLDLSVLYGTSEAQVDSVRRNDGTGRLWNDVFADNRLLFMPPAACALLVLLSRNHNYVAQKILDINERHNFSNPPPTDKTLRKAQDDEIFERARLVNCGMFVHIILGDYVGSVLGLVRDGFSWRLDPLMAERDHKGKILPRGEGNVVAVEFNLLYTWHAALSVKDAEWITNMIKHAPPGASDSMTQQGFREMINKVAPRDNIQKWSFGGLKRTESGSFKDADLAELLFNAIEQRAGAFGARGIPEALRFVEKMIIERSRKWGTCTLNEFRKFMGLKPYSNFKEWNPNQEIADAAASLYHDINNLELHVGLQAEEIKSPGEGAGLCPGYTISKAILSDAVCLTRGDRFYTIDYTPANYTLWGYQDTQYDRKDGSYGGLLTKLLYRTLPDHFPSGSAFAHFPFLEPSWMRDYLIKEERDIVNQYTWTRPPPVPEIVAVESYEQVRKVLSDPAFKSDSEDRLYEILKSPSTDKGTQASHTQAQNELVQGTKTASQKIFGAKAADYFARKTRELINEKSSKFVNASTKCVDIIKDVINELPVRWMSDTGVISTTTAKDFTDVGRYVYINDDPVNDWHLRSNAQDFVKAVIVEGAVSKAEAAHAIAAAVPTAPFFSKTLAHVVDYYVSRERQKEREEIVKLAKENKTANVMIYVKEALRHCPIIPGFYRTVLVDGGQSTQRVYVSIANANSDSSVFRDGTSADYPTITGFENIGFFTHHFFEETVSAVLKVILDLDNIDRVPGVAGNLNRFTENFMGTLKTQYTNSQGQVTPWPESMVIQYQSSSAKL